ncbi:MAG: tRNA lysidine(34) synthetase TilS [Devosia sp.]
MPGVSRVPDSIDADALFAPLDDYRRLGLAVSGGPDSLALLLLAHRFAEGTGTRDRFVVYAVDHGLRPEAAGEVAFVVREAERLGFKARALRWEGVKPATGIQEAARLARYRLIAEAMAEDGAQVLLTAHHLGDQAETILMRMAHGSGLEGLRGMDYFSEIGDLKIIRPLLGVDPADLRAVVDAAGIVPVADPSNSDIDYERVRWRRAMPMLAALGLDAKRLARFAERMRDADRALESLTSRAFAEVSVSDTLKTALIDRALLMSLPRAVAARVIGRALDRVGDGKKPHALAAVEALTDRLILERVRATLHGCVIHSDRGIIRIEREPGRAAAAARRRKEPSVS